jgi:hypothetical protein
MHHFGEAKDQEGEGIALGGCQGCKLRVTRFNQWVKVISTGDHGAVSVREFGDGEQD